MLALMALALVLAPLHGHEGTSGDLIDRGSVVSAPDAGSPTPESPPDQPDHKAEPCSVCLGIKLVAVPQQVIMLVTPLICYLTFPPFHANSSIVAVSVNLFRPPIRIAA